MKSILTVIGFLISILTFGQTENDTIKVLAKLITPGQGSKVYIAKYSVVRVLNGEISIDTIQVGYYFYTELEKTPNTAVLTLLNYNGDTEMSNYFIFPDYDAKKGIEQAKIETIDFDYWEGCETGQGECKPLTFTRGPNLGNWFLIVPCGGTLTTVTLSKQKGIVKEDKVIQKIEINHNECPPIFDLTNLSDGKYFTYMLACSLGGQIEINLKTKKE